MTVIDFGLAAYETIYREQKRLVEARINDEVDDTLLVGEHHPVITLGRKRSSAANLISAGEIPVLQIERGGDITYHGPGQLILYPIFKLEGKQQNLHQYLWILEEAIIQTLDAFNIRASRQEGATGVWVESKKIASIGIAVKKWVTYHGLALNISTDLEAFQAIRPCGFESHTMTSMQVLLGNGCPTREMVQGVLCQKLKLTSLSSLHQRLLCYTQQTKLNPVSLIW